VAAGVYAARKRLRTIFLAEVVGGQSTDSQDIQNWVGVPHITGMEFQQALEKHLREYAEGVVDIKIGNRVVKIEKKGATFLIQTGTETLEARAVLVASGGVRRKLEVPGAAAFENKGVTYCASCDGPLFTGQDVAVVGGGNAGFETAAQLLAYCKSVTLVHRSAAFARADAATVEAVQKHPNFKTLTSTEPVEVKGAAFVSSLVIKNKETGVVSELPVTGVFVEVGMLPSTDFAEGLVELDEFKRIKVNPKNQRTYPHIQTPKKVLDARRGEGSEEDVLLGTATEMQGPHNAADDAFFGVWAAGDCTDELYHQNNIAAGDGVKALEDIYFWIKAHS